MYDDFFGNTFRMCWSLRVIVVGVVIALLGLEASSQHYHETFEKGLKSPPWNEEGIKGSISTKQSVSGSKSWRAYLTAKKYRNARSEIRWTGGGTNTTNHHDNGSTWGVKLAVFFPSNFKPDKESIETIFQFHSVRDRGDTYRSAPFSMRLDGSTFLATNRWTAKKIASEDDQTTKTWALKKKVVPGKWHFFVIDMHWDYKPGGKGFLKIYMNVGSPANKGDLVVNYKGPTGYNDKIGSYFKMGIYKWDWNTADGVKRSKSVGVTERLLYYDDYEIQKGGFYSGGAGKANKPPKANAGEDLSVYLPANKIKIKGSGSDSDGKISSYAWSQVTGPSKASLKNANSATVEAGKLKEGAYLFRLTVTDNDGATDTDDVLVTVSKANETPTADAGADQSITLPTNKITLSGSGDDPDGKIKKYRWTQKSGPSNAALKDDDTPDLIASKLKAGVYVFTLTVTDDEGATDSDNVKVTVLDLPNQDPIADAGKDITITLPDNNTTINGSASDPDGSIKTHQWKQKSGPSNATLKDEDTENLKVSKLKEGTYVFTYTVTDNDGAKDVDQVKVIVEAAPNQAPNANAGPNITLTLPKNSVTINGSATDSDGSIQSHQWKQKSGPNNADLEDADTETLKISGLIEGTYVFTYSVTDDDDEKDVDQVRVEVKAQPNQAPSADAGANKNITLPKNSITIKGSGNDPDGSIESYLWKQSSGPTNAILSGENTKDLTASDLEAGKYIFQLTVTDNLGLTDKDNVQITVHPEAANEAPNANAGSNKTITLPISTVTLNGSGSDSDGTIDSYQWSQVSGPSTATFSGAGTKKLVASDLKEGRYVFKLSVTDNDGDVSEDNVTVVVRKAANQAPVANAGANKTIRLPKNRIILEGSSQDADGNISSHEWKQISGPKVTLSGINTLSLTISNLLEGTYQFELTVFDSQGASDKDQVTVTVLAPAPAIAGDVTNAICNTAGAISLSISQGKAPFTYQWSNGATTKDVGNIEPGEYSVTVKDSNGATSTKTFKVTRTSAVLKVDANIQNAICTASNGSIQVQASGGTAPYNYEWSSKARTSSLNKLAGGSYDLVVTDQNGCSKKFSFDVGIEAGEVTHDISSQVVNATCSGDDGSISIDVKGSEGPYSFVWDHGATGKQLQALQDGKYQVTITDKHGCYMVKQYTINQDPGPAKPVIKQIGDSLYVSQQAYTYQWFKDSVAISSETEQSLIITEAGRYSVQITNDKSCTSSSDYFYAKDPPPTASNNLVASPYVMQKVEFYPNPAISNINMQLQVNEPAATSVTIYDFQGRVMTTKELGMVNSQITESIDVELYPSGAYLIRVKAKDEIVTRRFLKH